MAQGPRGPGAQGPRPSGIHIKPPRNPVRSAFHLGIGPQHRRVDGVILVGFVGGQRCKLQDLAMAAMAAMAVMAVMVAMVAMVAIGLKTS